MSTQGHAAPSLTSRPCKIVTAEKVNIETTTYVRNIYKYYVSYTLMMATFEEQNKARDVVTTPAR